MQFALYRKRMAQVEAALVVEAGSVPVGEDRVQVATQAGGYVVRFDGVQHYYPPALFHQLFAPLEDVPDGDHFATPAELAARKTDSPLTDPSGGG